MTVLLIVAIIIAAIVVGILLVKVILEAWALFGSFPKSLAGFREHYWGFIARTITSLILILYGIWVLYCIFQFTHGDTLAAKALAAVTLVIFTAILAFFTWKIWSTARQLKQVGGDSDGLYYDKEIWVKYSLFYESYKKNYWWLFVPAIVYMFVKGAVLAATDGGGMVQAVSQLIIEALMLTLLLWSRPYERRSGNVVNIAIAIVRVLSVACILIFVEEFGIKQTTQTVAGVVLIVVQSALTGILAILIAWNAINACCKANPHRKRRKEMEKKQRDMDDVLTPLDARNTLLLDRPVHPSMGANMSVHSFSTGHSWEKSMARSGSPEQYYPVGQGFASPYAADTPTMDVSRKLVDDPAPMGTEADEPAPPRTKREYRGPVGPGFGYGQEAYTQDTHGAYSRGTYGQGTYGQDMYGQSRYEHGSWR
ncbi:Transient receptor potential (TRP) domain containing protein [Ophiocordyceps sinensis CO18]|nr:Transient receptor potential (TRP) domain containing protein [Ophiocordyceps sinensis CO18]